MTWRKQFLEKWGRRGPGKQEERLPPDSSGSVTRPFPLFKEFPVNPLEREPAVILNPDPHISDPHIADPLWEDHCQWMRHALQQAEQAFEEKEVPVGAIVVHHGRIIGEGRNQREILRDPTAHAEMLAITQAAETLGSWRLLDCTLYVTLEPCPMCAGAIVQARIPRIIYGTPDPKAGACDTLYNITCDPRLNHQAYVAGGVMATESAQLLKDFFAAQRALGKK